MTNTRKFSQFPPGTLTESVGLAGAVNTRGTGSGGAAITYNFTQAAAVVPPLYLGAAVRVDVATGLWNCTLATTPAGAEFYGFITAIAGTTYTVQFAGPAPVALFPGLIAGTPYYLSDTVAGGITAVPPSINGEVNLPVLWAMDNGNPVIKMSRGFVVGSGGGGGGGGGGTPNNVVNITQAAAFSLGDALYLSADQTFAKANAYSAFNAAQAEWVVTAIVTPGLVYTIQQGGQIHGVITLDGAGNPIVSGQIYYISSTIGQEGKLTPMEPVGAGLWSKPFYVQQVQASNTGWILDHRPLAASVPAPPFITATGGVITTVGNRKVHTFNAGGNFTITAGSGNVDYLIVAGAGGGGSNNSNITSGAGGGGAGGLQAGTTAVLGVGVYPVVVGAGGPGGAAGGFNQGGDGGNSSFNGVVSNGGGGGGGGGGTAAAAGRNGGSGGGSSDAFAAGTGTAGQGTAGGVSNAFAGSGGGGAGGIGGNAAGSNGGAGGNGTPSAITGVVVNYAAGGGGAAFGANAAGAGGLGGGGNGGTLAAAPTAGAANTGSGGGGCGNLVGAGAAGGSGVVILSYQFM